MQLSLLNRPASRRDDERPGSPSTLPGAWRDSAISQLDAIAAANDRRAATRMRTQAALFALLGLLALLISAWWPRDPRPPLVAAPTAAVAPSARGAVDNEAKEKEATAPAAPAVAGVTPAPPPMPAPSAAAATRVAAPAPATVASAARAAEARARAASAAAERRARENVPARTPAAAPRETATAIEAPPPARPSPAVAAESVPRGAVRTPEAAPRADVRSLCANSTFLAATFCQARECRKAEHQSDPTCVRLREVEQARERAAIDR